MLLVYFSGPAFGTLITAFTIPAGMGKVKSRRQEKQKIIHTIYSRAMELGFTKEDIVVDGLVATVGANRNAAIETMETIAYCKEEMQLDECSICIGSVA